jgi:hypothetical protein
MTFLGTQKEENSNFHRSICKILADLQVRFVSRFCEPANVLKCVLVENPLNVTTLIRSKLTM